MTSSITFNRARIPQQMFLSGVLLVPNPDVCWNNFSWEERNEVCVDHGQPVRS